MQPVGPRPPYVYWVRRLVLLALLVLAVVLLAHACSGGSAPARNGSLKQRADQQPLTSASTSPSPSSTGSAAPSGAACQARNLRVDVSSDATSYARNVRPRFTAVVKNTGPACRFPTALSSRTWRIMSGVDKVWSTADCPRSPDGKPVTLRAGEQITYVLPWDRFRSTPGCALEGAPAQAGTYRLYVTIAGATGPPALFHLAN